MGYTSDCDDHAIVEFYFANLKRVDLHRDAWLLLTETRSRVIYYIEVFHNTRRVHSALGHISPNAYELQLLLV